MLKVDCNLRIFHSMIYRIIKSHLFGDGSRTTENRGAIPYTVFIDPPLSRVGLIASEAKLQGYDILK